MRELLLIVYVCGLWQMLLVLVGLVMPGKRKVYGAGHRRVLVLIPAHNEEGVIRQTVEAVMRADCDAVVVCDSCTDMTWRRASELGAFVFRCEKHNKGAALNAFLSESLLPFAYDALAVVDCGTIVTPSFGGAVVAELHDAEYVQGWVRSAGRLTWVNAWYSWLYGLQHAMQSGRAALGLPVYIGGSGFAWRSTEAVRFDDRCLVEDLELSMRLHEVGKRVAYADLGVVDEKPSTLGVSIGQRERWARGGWWLFLHGRFITWRLDDFACAIGSITSVVSGLLLVRGLVAFPIATAVFLGVYALIGIAGMVRLGDAERFRLSILAGIPVMSLIESGIALVALFQSGRRAWYRTAHSIAEVAEHSG